MTDICPKCGSENVEMENRQEASFRCQDCWFIGYGDKFLNESTKQLAVFLHDRYEEAAKESDWSTQDGTSVDFSNLPVENKRTMLKLAKSVKEKQGQLNALSPHTDQ